MKIRNIKYQNFRNFKDPGQIDFPTDGTITIIYGPNGVGKTTLHQLFQWIFYGEVHFNKTASNKMYNLQYEREVPTGSNFCVRGSIDFEQENEKGEIEYYSIAREWKYLKQVMDSKKIEETVHIYKKVGDDWKRLDTDSEIIIGRFLPQGLSQYFFFDGESMIADLNQKGRDSAKSLRKALYSILDLDIYEQALIHIGEPSSSSSSTVFGRLYMDKSKDIGAGDVIKARGQVNLTQKNVDDLEKRLDDIDGKLETHNNRIKELSEIIGSTPSRSELEQQRLNHRNTIKTLEDAITREAKSFGKDVVAQYPYLFLSRIVDEAKLRIGMKVEEDVLIQGLTKELVLSLLNEDTCICGHSIGDIERDNLNEWLKKFPPLSYKYIYDQFKKSSARWSTTYDSDLLVNHLKAIFSYRDEIGKHQQAIKDIDYELSNGTNVDEYISERAQLEITVEGLEEKRNQTNKDLGLQQQYLKQRKRKYDELVEANNVNGEVEIKVDLMKDVYNYFDNKLNSSAIEYSERLTDSIQNLLNQMLTSVRTVEITPQFQLSVKDSFGDEAKSEGQFAVVSFAYIGGILKLLSEIPELKNKEFPLVLDGPFSKLDVIQRQNVINTIPAYAPQIILFSKDDLSPCLKGIDCQIWTIYSNDERNVSYVKKGYDPEVFTIDED